jgi:hypothetical protein
MKIIPNFYSIYGIYNNDILLYIGSASSFIKRKTSHLCNIKYNNTNSKIKLYQHIKNNNLVIDIKEILSKDCTKDEIAVIEAEYISSLKPLLNQRQSIKLSTRFKLRDYQRQKYLYYKELKKLNKINI